MGEGQTTIKVDGKNIDRTSDIYVMAKEKSVSVTPVSLDLTSRVEFHELNKIFK